MSYCCVGLDNPKFQTNIGSVLRAAFAFDVSMVAISNRRIKLKRTSTDTSRAYRHIPVISIEDLHMIIPFDCVPVAVDLLPEAINLYNYEHPKRAFYIFGAEDATLGKRITEWCRDIIYVPTKTCLNLAACVNVVLYDRRRKRAQPNKRVEINMQRRRD